MSQPNVYGTAVMISPEARMARIGVAMKELAKFWWIGICLSFLIIPAILLFVKTIKLIIELHETQKIAPNEDLNHAVQGIVLGWVINVIGGVIIRQIALNIIIGIVGFVLMLWGYISLEKWAIFLNMQNPTINKANFAKAMSDYKVAQILCIIIIGIFMIPGALHRGADALMAEYGQNLPAGQGYIPAPQGQPSYPQQGYQQGYAPAPQSMPYQQTIQQPAFGVPANSVLSPQEGAKFCPNCGALLPTPDIKFCGKCGSKIVI